MYILNTSQIREADKHTLEVQKISAAELMERAARACFDRIMDAPPPPEGYALFCGPGNNGGDGLVIARLLKNAGQDVQVYLLPAASRSKENKINLKKLIDCGVKPVELKGGSNTVDMLKGKTVIDALLGSGLNRPLEGFCKELIEAINGAKNFMHQLISIDSPSGFYSDEPMPEKAISIQADLTLCFASPRLMFFFTESFKYTGNWQVLDIGLEITEPIDTYFYYTLAGDLANCLTPRLQFSHKGNYGHALVTGGSGGKCGAVMLAAHACMRSGSGLTTALIPGVCYNPMQTAIPEVMVISGEEKEHLASSLQFDQFDAIGFGPGAGTHSETASLLKRMIQDANAAMVIDADGLNILAENKTWLAFLSAQTILTPHPGEFDRLVQKSANGYERLMKAREIAIRFQLIIVLKGAFTAVIGPSGNVHFNSTGNPGMATGGSGDVLTGIITALLAQGIAPLDAARLSVFVHGLAGDMAREQYGTTSLIARDIIEYLPEAFKVFVV